jgi:hypothetical protein
MLQYANSTQLSRKEARMAALANPRHEAYAQHRARGLSQRESARAATYKSSGYGSQLDKHDKVKPRIDAIKEALPWGSSRDLAPVIGALVETAKAASQMKSAAGLKAAGELWRQVAELKQKLPDDPYLVACPDPPTTPQEWLERNPPKP